MVRQHGRRIEVHPASEGPPSERALVQPHAWTTRVWVHIGLTADPDPENIGHELMHVVLAGEGYPNALRFVGSENEDTMVPLCGVLDVEVDRRLAELGMPFADTVEDAEAMMKLDVAPPHWTTLHAAHILLGRLRRIPSDMRPAFEAWASRVLPAALPTAIELDRRLPEALSLLDVTIGVILAAAMLDVALGFMPAHSNVDAPEKVKAWQMAVRAHAATLGVADVIEPMLATWTERAILEEDWTEAA